MLLPLHLDDIKYFIDNYRFLFNTYNRTTAIHNINNRRIESETFWCSDYQCYITCSSDYKRLVGRGFEFLLSEKDFVERLTKFLNNAKKRGRRKRNSVLVSYRVSQDIKAYIDSICKQYNINQGEFIAELVEVHKILMTIEPEPTEQPEP